MANEFLWWRDGVIYQIYPRSFADSNGDGIGDLNGIRSKLDYLRNLGIDAIWLSPFYPSPDADFGYDIADHCAVDPRFGNLKDFDELLADAHSRGIRVVLDLVLNHTSEAHPWFRESRSDRNNAKRDWYIWRPKPMNNWSAVFGGSAWTRDKATGEFYLHLFAKEQPDLNWRNPAVRSAQMDVVRFWLNRGVDGFRLDVFNAYFKDEALRSNPRELGLRAFDRQKHVYDINQAELLPLLAELRAILDKKEGRYAVGETFLGGPKVASSYCGSDRLHAAFNFDFTMSAFKAGRFRRAVETWERASGETVWPNYVLSNHDQKRAATRYCRFEDDGNAAVAMALLLTLRGTPFLYYGEEIGLRDIHLKRREILDPPGRYYWPFYKGRDACRAPMQWSSQANAGFTTGKPWLPIHPDYTWRNVALQNAEPSSLLNLTRQLIALRRSEATLRRGSLRFLDASTGLLRYERVLGGNHILVELDFANRGLPALPSKPLFADATSRIRLSRL